MTLEELTQEERDRLWQHALHEDLLFNERLNSFVGFQSVILAMAGALVLAKPGFAGTLVQPAALIGIVTCLLSAFLQGRQAQYVRFLGERCRQHLPEYRETHNLHMAIVRRRVSSQRLYAYLLPLLFTLVWCILLTL